MRLAHLLAALIAVLAGGILTARAEDIFCPPEKPMIPTKFATWEPEYSGFLNRVWFSASYDTNGAPFLTTVTCYRSAGSMTIHFKDRVCRLLAGDGAIEVLEQTKKNETIHCTLADKKHKIVSMEKTNDKQCMISCN